MFLYKKFINLTYFLIIFILLAFFLLPFKVFAQSNENRSLDFETKLGDITLMTGDSITMDNKKPKFDRTKATKKRFSKQSIDLAQQLTNFSKELAENNFEGDINKYPEVKKFFEEANKASEKGGTIPNTKTNSIKKNKFEIQTEAASAGDLAGRLSCGTYGNPRPSSAKSYQSFKTSDPAKTAKDWGYHNSENIRGRDMGWTRPQTWNWFACGFNTYRDNIAINKRCKNYGSCSKWQDTTNDTSYLVEQNYSGWNPRGEPNVEVWASGPWPYADWPAYVYWWHDRY
jgi:hypothetical protein